MHRSTNPGHIRTYLLEIVTLLQIVNDSPLKMYSKFVLSNWTLFSHIHILKWVREWPVMGEHMMGEHYFELCKEYVYTIS